MDSTKAGNQQITRLFRQLPSNYIKKGRTLRWNRPDFDKICRTTDLYWIQEVTCGLYSLHRSVFFMEFMYECNGAFRGTATDKDLSDHTLSGCGSDRSDDCLSRSNMVYQLRPGRCSFCNGIGRRIAYECTGIWR